MLLVICQLSRVGECGRCYCAGARVWPCIWIVDPPPDDLPPPGSPYAVLCRRCLSAEIIATKGIDGSVRDERAGPAFDPLIILREALRQAGRMAMPGVVSAPDRRDNVPAGRRIEERGEDGKRNRKAG